MIVTVLTLIYEGRFYLRGGRLALEDMTVLTRSKSLVQPIPPARYRLINEFNICDFFGAIGVTWSGLSIEHGRAAALFVAFVSFVIPKTISTKVNSHANDYEEMTVGFEDGQANTSEIEEIIISTCPQYPQGGSKLDYRRDMLDIMSYFLDTRSKFLDKRSNSLDKRSNFLNTRSDSLDDKRKLLDDKRKLLDDKRKLLDHKRKLLDHKRKLLDDKRNLLNTRSDLLDARSNLLDTRSNLLDARHDGSLISGFIEYLYRFFLGAYNSIFSNPPEARYVSVKHLIDNEAP